MCRGRFRQIIRPGGKESDVIRRLALRLAPQGVDLFCRQQPLLQHQSHGLDLLLRLALERQVLDQVGRQQRSHAPVHHRPLAQHVTRVPGILHRPPGPARQLVGKALCTHRGHDGLGFTQQQQLFEAVVTHLAHACPALQVYRVTTRRPEYVSGQHFLYALQVGLFAPGGIELDLRLAFVREAEYGHGRCIDPDRLRLVGQQYIET